MRLLALLLLTGCAAAPVGYRTGNPNCLAHCVIMQVEAPEATAVTATQSGGTSVQRSISTGP